MAEHWKVKEYLIATLTGILLMLLGARAGEWVALEGVEQVVNRQAAHEAMAAHPVSLEAQTRHRREADRRFDETNARLLRIEQKIDLLIRQGGD